MKKLQIILTLFLCSILMLGMSPDPHKKKKHKNNGKTECERVTDQCEQRIANETQVLRILTGNFKRNQNPNLLREIKQRSVDLKILQHECAAKIRKACDKKIPKPVVKK